jgi:peptidyl-prolyl cis-trans isomerase C
MTYFRTLILLTPMALALAQTPPPAAPPQPVAPPQASAAPAPEPKKVPPDRVVLTVGDQKITAAEFDAVVETLPEQARAMVRGAGRDQFADTLVKLMALAGEGKRLKLDASAAFQAEVRFRVADMLAGKVYEQLTKTAKPDEAQLKKYFDEHKADYEQVKARHILIRMQGSPAAVRPGQKELTEAEALAKAQDLRKKLAAGGDFAKLAETESDDTGSGANGGDLGSFRHGQMVPSFEEAAFALKPGELSQPVKTQFGYHLIKVESKETQTFDDVKVELERQLGPQQAQMAVDDLVKKAVVARDPDFFPAAAPAPVVTPVK